MERIPLETWFFEVPPVTRYLTLSSLVLSLLTQADLLSPLQLFFSYGTVFRKHQWWRLVTTFVYLGDFGMDFLLHLYFMARYCRMLEDEFARRPVDFLWGLALMSVGLLLLSPLSKEVFLGGPLSFAITYLWSRRNRHVEMSFLGVFQFSAAWLPLVLLAFGAVVHGRVQTGDCLGLAVAHIYFFLEDVWPACEGSGGRRWLACPETLRRVLGQRRESHEGDVAFEPAIEAAPAVQPRLPDEPAFDERAAAAPVPAMHAHDE